MTMADVAEVVANDGAQTFKGKVESFQGEKLPYALDYEASYTPFGDEAAIRKADKWPTISEIVTFVNAQEKANARATAIAKRLADEYKATNNPIFKKLDASTEDGQRMQLIKTLMKAHPKWERDKAEKMADTMMAAE